MRKEEAISLFHQQMTTGSIVGRSDTGDKQKNAKKHSSTVGVSKHEHNTDIHQISTNVPDTRTGNGYAIIVVKSE